MASNGFVRNSYGKSSVEGFLLVDAPFVTVLLDGLALLDQGIEPVDAAFALGAGTDFGLLIVAVFGFDCTFASASSSAVRVYIDEHTAYVFLSQWYSPPSISSSGTMKSSNSSSSSDGLACLLFFDARPVSFSGEKRSSS